MSRSAQAVLDAFEQLPPQDREQVFRELLRRTAMSDHESFTDEELAAAGAAVFAMYDREESGQ